MAEGERAEAGEIFGDMPGDRAVCADDAVVGTANDEGEGAAGRHERREGG